MKKKRKRGFLYLALIDLSLGRWFGSCVDRTTDMIVFFHGVASRESGGIQCWWSGTGTVNFERPAMCQAPLCFSRMRRRDQNFKNSKPFALVSHKKRGFFAGDCDRIVLSRLDCCNVVRVFVRRELQCFDEPLKVFNDLLAMCYPQASGDDGHQEDKR